MPGVVVHDFIPAKESQEDLCEVKVSLVYVMSSRSVKATQRDPVSDIITPPHQRQASSTKDYHKLVTNPGGVCGRLKTWALYQENNIFTNLICHKFSSLCIQANPTHKVLLYGN